VHRPERCPLGLVDLVGARFANRSDEVEDLEAQFFVSSSAERARDERMPLMVVGYILDPVVQCAEGLVRRRPSIRHRRGRQPAAGRLQVAVFSRQSSSASPARAAVGPGALRSGRRRAFDALA
jgi:hypothetical protein